MPTPHSSVDDIICTNPRIGSYLLFIENITSEGVSSFHQEVQKGSIETGVRHLLKLRNENVRISKDSYNDSIESLVSIGRIMPYVALRKGLAVQAKWPVTTSRPPKKQQCQF